MTAPDDASTVTEICRRLTDQSGDVVELVGDEVRRLAPLHTPLEQQSLVAVCSLDSRGSANSTIHLHDPDVDEVMVNAGRTIWIDRGGVLQSVGVLETDRVEHLIERVLAPLGRRVDRSSPIVDARLPGGARVCAVLPPVAVDGAALAIRRFTNTVRPLAAFVDDRGIALLQELVQARCNIVVSGATSSGKTSLVAALLATVPASERLIVVEDTTEFPIEHPHLVRLEARPATIDGPPAIEVADLVRTALRLRPDRIVVGEVRGHEALALVQAMNTGHDGSISTCHANSPLDALLRLETLVLQASPSWPLHSIRLQLARSIDVVVHIERAGVLRRISAICEVVERSGRTDAADPSARLRSDGSFEPVATLHSDPPMTSAGPPLASGLVAGVAHRLRPRHPTRPSASADRSTSPPGRRPIAPSGPALAARADALAAPCGRVVRPSRRAAPLGSEPSRCTADDDPGRRTHATTHRARSPTTAPRRAGDHRGRGRRGARTAPPSRAHDHRHGGSGRGPVRTGDRPHRCIAAGPRCGSRRPEGAGGPGSDVLARTHRRARPHAHAARHDRLGRPRGRDHESGDHLPHRRAGTEPVGIGLDATLDPHPAMSVIAAGLATSIILVAAMAVSHRVSGPVRTDPLPDEQPDTRRPPRTGNARRARHRRSRRRCRGRAAPGPDGSRHDAARPSNPSRARRTRGRRAAERALPDAMDLLVLSVRAGLTPQQAIRDLAASAPDEVRPAFALAAHRGDRGQAFADTLAALPEVLGASALSLADGLASSERYGLPVGPMLDQLVHGSSCGATTTRRRRRPQAAGAPVVPLGGLHPALVRPPRDRTRGDRRALVTRQFCPVTVETPPSNGDRP